MKSYRKSSRLNLIGKQLSTSKTLIVKSLKFWNSRGKLVSEFRFTLELCETKRQFIGFKGTHPRTFG